ncbi:hypothetical protein [Caenispirillum bisanense]|uniref:hypothetical protein n=1 Tax=Caenispirillum bisanense TaxID=414052 RepID=UPI0031D2457A
MIATLSALPVRWRFTLFGLAAAWLLWAVAMVMAFAVPSSAVVPLHLRDVLAGFVFSNVLFGGCGYIFGWLIDNTFRRG